ncbi:hypothetical protein [Chitinophaga niabensis]|uniref:Uncharacterized protein n=1 Tax=Chitinophaga niabensis TaxID=536979 RepID=A0A1N6JYC8_9BACT|nr:hypothetical protein [Chitinophaga niabensis]SIO49263.1 hypothetical protein SAMN04488055_4683 [Chitinophaga niabensis]
MSRFFKKPTQRVVVYPKDVAEFTGKGIRAAQRMLAVMRKALGKHKKAIITVREFCMYWNILESEWWDRMSNHK